MNKPLKVGLCGFGLSGSVFHAPFLHQLKEFELVKVLTSKAEKVHSLYPNVEVVSDYEELLTEEIELVIITTPNHLHFTQTKRALEANKHVLVEKPLTPTVAEARELIQLANEKERVLSVFHNRRYDGDFLSIKKIISEKKLGEVVYLESHFDRFRPQIGQKNWREEETTLAGGVLFDLGPHLLDQALVLFGKPEAVIIDKALQREGSQQDDYFHLVLKYQERRVVLHSSSIAAKPGARFLVHGTQGSLEITGLDPQEARLKQDPNLIEGIGKSENRATLYTQEGEHSFDLEEGSYKQFYLDLYSCINSQGKNPASAQESLNSLEIICSVFS